MHLPKALVIGVLASIPVGVLLAVVQEGTTEQVRAPVDDSPMALPVGHVGDRLTYAVYDRWNDRCYYGAGTPAFTDFYDGGSYRRLSGAQSFVLAGVETRLDADSRPREVLNLQWNGSVHWDVHDASIFPETRTFFAQSDYRDDWYEPDLRWAVRQLFPCDWPEGTGHAPPQAEAPPPETGQELLARASAQNDGQRRQFVDFASRTVIRDDVRVPFRDPVTEIHLERDGTSHTVTYEEATGVTVAASFGPSEAELTGLRYQGRTIRLGDILVPETHLAEWNGGGNRARWENWLDERSWSVGSPRVLAVFDWQEDRTGLRAGYRQWSAEVADITLREWVADRAVVNGKDAYGIRTEVTVRYRAPSPPGHGPYDWMTWRSVVVNWMTQDVPYPILVQSNRFDRVLVSYTPGTEPIPWDESPGSSDLDPSQEEVERFPGAYPADGSPSPLRYPLQVALEDARGAAGLDAFAAWQDSHPGSQLVAADYSVEGPALDEAVWRLIFATPDGQAYEIHARNGPTHRVAEVGPRLVPPFGPEDAPANPATIAQAVATWRAHASPALATEEPNAVHWGYEAWVVGGTHGAASLCHGMDDFRAGDGFETEPGEGLMTWVPFRDPLAELRAGHESFERCESGSAYSRTTSLLTIDTRTGSVAAFWEDRAGLPSPDHDFANLAAPEVVREASIRLRPPDIERATFFSASLAALFVTAYLAPAMKFAATKLGIAVAGFSKLVRERLLDNRVRDDLLEAIESDPGTSATELGRCVHAGWGTVVYHLSVLERNHMISSLVDGRHRRFFPVGRIDWSRRGQVAALKHERAKALFERIAQEPGVFQETLVGALGLSRASTIWHLKRLEGCGLVGRVKKGRKVHYYANEEDTAGRPPPDGMEIT